MRTDEGSIVFGWLSKLVVLFALLGVVAFDGVHIVVANFGAADDATTAARAAADAFQSSKSVQAAYDAAAAALADKPDDVVETTSFQVTADGAVSLVVTRTTHTLWMHRVGPLASMAEVSQTGTASPSS